MTKKLENDATPAIGEVPEGPLKPIDFTANLDKRRAERQQRRRDVRKADAAPALDDVVTPRTAPPPVKTRAERQTVQRGQQKGFLSLFRRSLTALSFLLFVAVPSAATLYYYYVIASPQYRIEAQFSVRGSNQTASAALGIAAMFGNSVQSGDSYIVASYVESLQLIRDVKSQLGIDLRSFYSRETIDPLYRIKPDMPLEEFVDYWRDVTDVSFNSTTGNITFYLYAFSAEDSKTMADAVLKASETLVNNLSESSREQMTQVAMNMVERSEERLRKVRAEIQTLRSTEQALDPAQIMALQNQVTSSIESQLSNLRTRLAAVTKAASSDTPSAKVLKRQIDALEQQLADQKSRLGPRDASKPATGANAGNDNLSDVVARFEALNVELGFATQAYTSSLAAFESALLEAQKQERYFATFVLPATPEVALYPLRMIDSIVAFLIFLAAWLVIQFLYRSVRDHAV